MTPSIFGGQGRGALDAEFDFNFLKCEIAVDTRLTTSGASSGMRVNSSGSEVSKTCPRLEFDATAIAAKGLLVEEQRTNLIFPSAATGWTATPAGSVIDTANAATSPDGTIDATKIATNDTLLNGHGWFKTFTGAINTAYVASGYFKAAEYSRVSLYLGNTGFASINTGALFDLSNGTVVATANSSIATITSVGNGWYRCTVSATSDADGGTYVFVLAPAPASVATMGATYAPASTGLGIYVYGMEVEAGAFVASDILTTTAAVTRTADSVALVGSSLATASGTYLPEFTTGAGLVSSAVYWGVSATGTSNGSVYLVNSAGNLALVVKTGGVAQAALNLGALAANTTYKVGISLDTAAGEVAARVNGGAEKLATGITFPATVDMGVGRAPWANTGHACIWMRRIRKWSRTRRNELATLTT